LIFAKHLIGSSPQRPHRGLGGLTFIRIAGGEPVDPGLMA
jgi:hypothetical protein